MGVRAVSHCQACQAIVNIHWPTCIVCHASLPVPLLSATPEPQSQSQRPICPIPAGRLITYRGADGRLRGGDLDRAQGTVAVSEYGVEGWTITLTDGQAVSLSDIRGVARLSSDGQVVEAWTVRAHGMDGNKEDGKR